MNLREILEASKEFSDLNSWLYLPSSLDWTLDTEGHFFDPGEEELSRDGIPLAAKELGLVETLDASEIQSVTEWADQLSKGSNPSSRLEVFIYYHRFNAFPDKLGAPDPPSHDQVLARLDREFYDSLGFERDDASCRHDSCGRGAIQFSAFCRRHHFESVKKKACPFAD